MTIEKDKNDQSPATEGDYDSSGMYTTLKLDDSESVSPEKREVMRERIGRVRARLGQHLNTDHTK
ncbi:hypothetical protein A3D88_03305 [Candidatus Peribacteria bacterium RIFCSPHIGHO2_02_FULL_52_16]|nr:MAG: hypothetical protein A2706_04125 [Candidatus Peribacteria bacterium RIFCSPHIGHO2_01_FULL_51_35]OGJ61357.1 MAG: hypothetical protein A3D88_03305 [Candidatus Peribacteria bacterium RIFCSPHIGHO2_02_FULL_52_16]